MTALATYATMPTVGQILFDRLSAFVASLTCAMRVHLNKCSTSVFCFVRQIVKEYSPSGIMNGFRQHTTSKTLDVQIFNTNYIILFYNLIRKFMKKVSSLICDPLILFCKKHYRLFSAIRFFISLSGNASLKNPKFILRLLMESWIINKFSIGCNHKIFKTHVNAYFFVGFLEGAIFYIAGKRNIIFFILPRNRDCFNFTFNWSVQPNINIAHPLQINFVRFQFTSIAIGRIRYCIKSLVRLISGKANIFLFTFNSIKKCPVSFINSAENILTGRKISQLNHSVFPELFELISLVVIINALPCYPVRFFSFFNGAIIKLASIKKLVINQFNLRFIGIQAIFERLYQYCKNMNIYYNDKKFSLNSWKS